MRVKRFLINSTFKPLKPSFPTIDVYYFVRGRPIINDLTSKDALASNMDEVAIIVDSGVPTPGLVMELHE